MRYILTSQASSTSCEEAGWPQETGQLDRRDFVRKTSRPSAEIPRGKRTKAAVHFAGRPIHTLRRNGRLGTNPQTHLYFKLLSRSHCQTEHSIVKRLGRLPTDLLSFLSVCFGELGWVDLVKSKFLSKETFLTLEQSLLLHSTTRNTPTQRKQIKATGNAISIHEFHNEFVTLRKSPNEVFSSETRRGTASFIDFWPQPKYANLHQKSSENENSLNQ